MTATNWSASSVNASNWTKQSINASNFGRKSYLSIADDTVTLADTSYIVYGYDPSVIDKYTNAVNWS